MKKNAVFLAIFINVLIFNLSTAQTTKLKYYKLMVNLDNASFDSVYLYDYTDNKNILIPGRKIKKFTWEIMIPHDLSNDENMELMASPYDNKSDSKQLIRFKSVKGRENIIIVNVGLNDENNSIYGVFSDTTVFSNEKVLTRIDNKDSSIVGDLICADFNLVIKDPNSDIAIRSQDPLFSWFMDINNRDIPYKVHLNSYIELAKKYPDSRFLLNNLSRNITKYKSKSDLSEVYRNFSPKLRTTIWAKHIEEFLNENKFPNILLPSTNNDSLERMIQDTTKYNLVVFTASWCKPCIEEIPILKKIYKDLGEDLIMTYISIDDEKGVSSFKNLVKEKNISWRSLFAYQDIDKIKQKYFIEGIPKTILVYPSQETKVLDVRNDKDRMKLYNLIMREK